jgi:16S rRNA processing protein RimM
VRTSDSAGTEATAPDFVAVGLVRNAHGIRGELVVEAITDAPDAIFASGRRVYAGTAGAKPARGGGPDGLPPTLSIVSARPFKGGGYIVEFREIADRTAAQLWRGRYLLLPQDELAPPADDEIYYHDMLGMSVELEDGTVVGRVREVFELPQGLTLDVSRATGKGTVLIPYRPEIVLLADMERRTFVVAPPLGLLD